MIAFVIGLVAAALLQPVVLRLKVSRLTVENYRGRPVKAVGGIVLAAGLVTAQVILGTAAGNWSKVRSALLVVALGFFVLGLIDDLATSPAQDKGLGGHLKALLGGRVTTGALKAAGGLLLAGAVGLVLEPSPAIAALNALVVALSANLINLLDLGPGRASKVFLLLWPALAAAAGAGAFREVSGALGGATLAWLVMDLRERGMLGDAGANMLGAVLGAGVVLSLGVVARSLVLVVLLGLTLASERWSFSRGIDACRPLRWFDRLGRV